MQHQIIAPLSQTSMTFYRFLNYTNSWSQIDTQFSHTRKLIDAENLSIMTSSLKIRDVRTRTFWRPCRRPQICSRAAAPQCPQPRPRPRPHKRTFWWRVHTWQKHRMDLNITKHVAGEVNEKQRLRSDSTSENCNLRQSSRTCNSRLPFSEACLRPQRKA